MKKVLLVLAVALSGCSSYALHHANRMGIATATLATACDWGSTSWAMSGKGGWIETNPMLGASPSQARVAEYMGASMVLTAAVWYVLPERYRPLLWGSVTAIEVNAVASNMGQDVPLCGIP